MQRNRIIYAVGIFIVILLGLASRSQSPIVPSIAAEYAGDALWALVVYLLTGFLFPRFSIVKTAVAAGVFSLTIEISQLYHAPWIEYLRRLRLGGLILGFGFLWSDLVCYFLGICTGVLLEYVWQKYTSFNHRFPIDE